MADISGEKLIAEIHAILKTADFSAISTKKVREQIEKKFKCSLFNRKKEFDKIVMEFVNSQQEDVDDVEEASSEEEKRPAKKRPQPTPRKAVPPKKKRKSLIASDAGTESDGGDDLDFEASTSKKRSANPKKKKAAGTGGARSESDGGDDLDFEASTSKKRSANPKEKKAAGTGGARKSTGFTRAYNLSPELSSLMGAEALPRHEVVKKVWAIIKERNLYDPNNKQFAICDEELRKVMKVKRFRTFGMLKHLKPHFLP